MENNKIGLKKFFHEAFETLNEIKEGKFYKEKNNNNNIECSSSSESNSNEYKIIFEDNEIKFDAIINSEEEEDDINDNKLIQNLIEEINQELKNKYYNKLMETKNEEMENNDEINYLYLNKKRFKK
jgi:hypothetical protein